MMSHSYNTRNNSLASNGNDLESRSNNRPATHNTCKLIISLEKKIKFFECLHKEPLNIKNIIIKGFQIENQQLCSRINNLEKQVVSLEENKNLLEEYS